ncbi:MAG: hypothetical protein K940chlam9_00369 [Chlamydiae bacterium]|nr:hypothetical protein [Chlamydiota bacterium]
MDRPRYLEQIRKFFRTQQVVATLGPRQCGKTTLAKIYCNAGFSKSHYFDLEDPQDLARLEQPKLALEPLEGLVVIDEIQRIPELFPFLRVLVDQDPKKKFLILGSASRDLIRQSSETLAGRIAYIELPPFSFLETKALQSLWLRGGFPRSFLAESDEDSWTWREFYISTFLERDIPQLGIQIPPVALRRFWSMLAHYHGNIFNASEIGNSFGASHGTMRRYLDLLTGTFMVRQLPPWFENLKKRQVKSPKIYFRDTGLLHSLLGIADFTTLLRHPKLGTSWEGFALEEILRTFEGEAYFWATHSGAELDLLLLQRGRRIGFEIKYADAPRLTKSMRICFESLHLDKLIVVYPGEVDYLLAERIEVKGLAALLQTSHLL